MAVHSLPGISVSQLKARLRDNPIGAFAFYGPEELLKHFYLDKFVTLLEKEGGGDFNIARLDFARDATVSELLGEGEILPFGGDKRLVICRGLSPAKLSDADTKQILAFLESFPPYLILIFYLEHEEFGEDKKDLKKKNVLALTEKMTFVSFPIQEERVLLPWAKKILAADGVTAGDGVLRTLFRLCRSKMQLIRSELEKLSCWALSQGKGEVTEEDVLLFARDNTEFAVYNLCDAVLEGAVGAAEKILRNLKNQDVSPILIGASLASALTGAMLVAEGASASDCAKSAKVLPWQFDKYRRSLYGKKKENVEKALGLCLELDRTLKGTRSDIWVLTELYVMQMAMLLGKAQ